jgi:hypothetical protein
MWWQIVVAVLAGLVLVWIGLVAVLYLVGRRQGDPVGYKEVLRLVPDIIRLVRQAGRRPDPSPWGADQVGPPGVPTGGYMNTHIGRSARAQRGM